MNLKCKLTRKIRIWCDRIDLAHAPRSTGFSFTFEQGQGAVFNNKGIGCPLWYIADSDYDRAHSETNPKVTAPGKVSLQFSSSSYRRWWPGVSLIVTPGYGQNFHDLGAALDEIIRHPNGFSG